MRTLFLLISTFVFFCAFSRPVAASDTVKIPWWSIQSVDTMKYSRDTALEKLTDLEFDKTIEEQVKNIADIGATHVAIATPYDEKFLPFLKRWVAAARRNNLNVWFRGNFSGWEGWFGYAKITPSEHMAKTERFILDNKELFANGDIFSPCPECENGAMGDPRQTGDVEGYRKFLIDETNTSREAFKKIGVNVIPNFISANGDVAKLIMDKRTTAETGGVVVIDHYVETPEKLAADISDLEKSSGGKIFLGEFGVPIPGINSDMDESQQAVWIDLALSGIMNDKNVIGLNYWVNVGGSTQLWNNDKTSRKAVNVLKKYFRPAYLSGTVTDDLGRAVGGAMIVTGDRQTISGPDGKFFVPYRDSRLKLTIKATGYKDGFTTINGLPEGELKVSLEKIDKSLLEKFFSWLANLLHSAIL